LGIGAILFDGVNYTKTTLKQQSLHKTLSHYFVLTAGDEPKKSKPALLLLFWGGAGDEKKSSIIIIV
jgi:hypothetical protein